MIAKTVRASHGLKARATMMLLVTRAFSPCKARANLADMHNPAERSHSRRKRRGDRKLRIRARPRLRKSPIDLMHQSNMTSEMIQWTRDNRAGNDYIPR